VIRKTLGHSKLPYKKLLILLDNIKKVGRSVAHIVLILLKNIIFINKNNSNINLSASGVRQTFSNKF
tara:strand:- start:294 stop:494 length:201 start_codon:yes stop_codon:yes gene_type:complete